jgi:hypothetical protein
MNKGLEIAGYLLEIVMALACIFVSIGIWKHIDETSKYSDVAKSYENYGVRVNNSTTVSMNN